MRPEENRRSFIGSVVFGIPLLAAGSAAAFTQSFRADDHGHAAAAHGDALLEHVEQQFAAMLQAARHRATGTRPNEVGTAAAYLQILAVHARSVQLNERARRALQTRIHANGREAVNQERLDLTHIRQTLATRGIELPERVMTAVSAPHLPQRIAAIDMVLRGDTSTVFSHMASTLESMESRRGHPRWPVRAVGYDDGGACDFYSSQMFMYFALAGAFCMSATGDPYYDEWCEAIWTAALVSDSIYWSNC